MESILLSDQAQSAGDSSGAARTLQGLCKLGLQPTTVDTAGGAFVEQKLC